MFTDHRCVTLTDGFWKQKADLNRTVTVPAVYDRFKETGRVDALRFAWKGDEADKPHIFWDSDIAKWLESAAYVLERDNDPDLQAKAEEIIDLIAANQQPDGYFNSYFCVAEPPYRRFTIRDWHELYCAGHLMEAACAYYNATGRDKLLRVMEKYADYIRRVFVEERSTGFETPGHEEIELALFKMYRTTGDKKYMELAVHFLELRGQPDNPEHQVFDHPKYAQSHAPIRDQHEAFGHAVRAMYLYSGMADYAEETGDEALLQACRDLYRDVTQRKMYVTGGIGSTCIGESFTIPYDLPNAGAYTETCASIGLIFFANRLFRADPLHPSCYADTVELALYNGALSGLSLDGDKFFYENPLEINTEERGRITAVNEAERWPITQRVKVFLCSCCPPNLTRLLASVGDYFYGYDEKEGVVYVNQFGTSRFEKDGVTVSQQTDYPLDGSVKITSNVPVLVRIPGWCADWGADADCEMVNGYAKFAAGTFTVTFAMRPQLIGSHARVYKNLGKAALRYGPFLYCAEASDNGGRVHDLYFDRAAVDAAVPEYDETFNAPVITLDGARRVTPSDELYAPLTEEFIPARLRLIPYYAFANRGEQDMLVFLNYR